MRKAISQLGHLSHIERINDWFGSGSYIGPAEIVERRTMSGERHPYMLLSKASGPHGIIQPGTVVMLMPHEVGPHHAKIPDHEYPPEAEPPMAEPHHPPMLVDMESRFDAMLDMLNKCAERIAALEKQMPKAAAPAPTPAAPAAPPPPPPAPKLEASKEAPKDDAKAG